MTFINKELLKAAEANGSPLLTNMAASPVARVTQALIVMSGLIPPVSLLTGVDTSVLSQRIPVWTKEYVDLSSYLAGQSSTLASELGVASEFSTLKTLMGDRAEGGCAELLGVSGIFTGDSNPDLELVAGYMEDINESMTKYIATASTASETQLVIDTNIPLIDNGTTIIVTRKQAEKDLLTKMFDYLKTVGFVQSLMALWDNPCAKAIAQECIPDNYRASLDNPQSTIITKLSKNSKVPRDFKKFT